MQRVSRQVASCRRPVLPHDPWQAGLRHKCTKVSRDGGSSCHFEQQGRACECLFCVWSMLFSVFDLFVYWQRAIHLDAMFLGCCGKRGPKDRRVSHTLLDWTDRQWDWRTVEMGGQLNNYNTVCMKWLKLDKHFKYYNDSLDMNKVHTGKWVYASPWTEIEWRFSDQDIVGHLPTASGCIKRLTKKDLYV